MAASRWCGTWLGPVVVAAATVAASAAAATGRTRPNIVFLVVESTDGRTWTPGYQNDAVALPSLRKLQNGGAGFVRHYSNAPVCCPSRATFWSGRHSSNIRHDHFGIDVAGVWNNYEGLPNNFTDRIDQVLDRNGYNTKLFGKLDFSTGGHGESSAHTDLSLWSMYIEFPYNITADGGFAYEVTGGKCDSNGTVLTGGSRRSGTGHEDDWESLDKGTAWLKQQAESESPFFVYQGMNIVHPPYVTNQYWLSQVNISRVEVPQWSELEQLHPCDLQSSMLKGCIPGPSAAASFYSLDRRRNVRAIYLAMIAEFDAMVGDYFTAVEEAGVTDNTVFIVTSDHGDMQFEHQQFYKMVPYDASARVPMVIYDGRKVLQSSITVSVPTQLIDIFPTVMDLAQVPLEARPSSLDGDTLLTLVPEWQDDDVVPLKAATPRPDFVVSQFHGKNIAMSWFLVVQEIGNTTYKLVVWGTGNEVQSQLFNLHEDPDENINLIKESSLQPLVNQLLDSLKSVVDYPTVALEVAAYNQKVFRHWVNTTNNWREAIAEQAYWQESWATDPAGAMKAFTNWLEGPPAVVPCRANMTWSV